MWAYCVTVDGSKWSSDVFGIIRIVFVIDMCYFIGSVIVKIARFKKIFRGGW